jgi:hypothetical protein
MQQLVRRRERGIAFNTLGPRPHAQIERRYDATRALKLEALSYILLALACWCQEYFEQHSEGRL